MAARAGSGAMGEQLVEDGAAVLRDERDVAVALRHARTCAGNVLREPAAVREGHHEIEVALPYGDRRLHRFEGETPRRDEREVVVDPAVESVGHRAAHRGG